MQLFFPWDSREDTWPCHVQCKGVKADRNVPLDAAQVLHQYLGNDDNSTIHGRFCSWKLRLASMALARYTSCYEYTVSKSCQNMSKRYLFKPELLELWSYVQSRAGLKLRLHVELRSQRHDSNWESFRKAASIVMTDDFASRYSSAKAGKAPYSLDHFRQVDVLHVLGGCGKNAWSNT